MDCILLFSYILDASLRVNEKQFNFLRACNPLFFKQISYFILL